MRPKMRGGGDVLIRPGDQLDFTSLPDPAGREFSEIIGRRQKKLRLCVVAHSLEHVGGSEDYVNRLVHGLAKFGGRIHLHYLTHDPESRRRTEKAGRGELVYHPIQTSAGETRFSQMNPSALARFGAELARTLDEDDVNIVHVHAMHFPVGGIAAAVAKMKGRNVAVTYHGQQWRWDSWKTPVFKTAKAATLTLTDRRLGVSFSAAKELGEDAVMIGTSVDTDFFNPQNPDIDVDGTRQRHGLGDSKIIFYPSRIKKSKGQLDLVEVAKSLEGMDFKILMAGPEDNHQYMGRLKKSIEEENLQGKLLILPAVGKEEVRNLYAVSDMMVFPTRREGLGLIALESLSMEKPVVAYPVGGVPEAVRDGETGILTEGISPVQMARGAAKLLDNPRMARSLGVRGRYMVRNEYSPDALIRKHMDVYADLF